MTKPSKPAKSAYELLSDIVTSACDTQNLELAHEVLEEARLACYAETICPEQFAELFADLRAVFPDLTL